MTRKRRAPNYAGALAQPIYWEDHYKPRGLGQFIQEPDDAAIRKRLVEKMRLLFEHYKIDPSDEQSWQKLAMSLALAHVPGLRLANRPKPGRKPTWKTEPGDEWVRAVDDVKSRTGKSTKKAIAELLEESKWRTYTSQRNISTQSLEARYWEARRRHQNAMTKWPHHPNLRKKPHAPSKGRGPVQRAIRRVFMASGAEVLNSTEIYNWAHGRRRLGRRKS